MNFSGRRIATSLSIVCLGVSLGAAQQRPLKTDQLRIADFSNVNMGAILETIATDYAVTIGFETDPNKPQSSIELHLRNVDFIQFLDGVVKAEPRYQWREHDGFIEVVPVNQGVSLLDTPISSFQVKDVSRELALNRLFGLPQVQAQTLSMGLKVRTPLPSDKTRDEKLSFNLSGVSLRQA